MQLKVVGALLILLLIWLGAAAATMIQRLSVEREREMLGAKAAVVARTENRVAAFRTSVGDIAERLEERQQRLDLIIARYFGKLDRKAAKGEPTASLKAVPEADRLAAIEKQQLAFATALDSAAAERSIKAETALRRLGINPKPVNAPVPQGVGGPYVPLEGSRGHFVRLAETMDRLDQLEQLLVALPSTKPASPVELSSAFGVRSDPFTHGAALHTGLDLRGVFGQPIYAAAAGRVVRVGPWSGYGNVVVIDHGHGIETRYGHLSGFTVREGQVVKAGQQVARMGSTGRSTGNHLHFEVRINGRAVNPRPFLEASSDVLEIKAGAGRRVGGAVSRS